MRWWPSAAVTVAGACVTLVTGTCAAAHGSGGWEAARQVLGVRIQGEFTVYTAPAYLGVSCPAPRDCTVAYMPPASSRWAPVFSMTMRDGAWGTPRQIPGLRAEPSGPLQLACVSAGHCIVAATAPHGTGAEVMVAFLAHGTWSQARPVPGLAALRAAYSSTLSALACGRTGWCALAGQYQPPVPHAAVRPFVASEHDGAWGTARPVPGLAALTGSWASDVTVISCDPLGTCTAAGYYRDHLVRENQPYAVTDRAGRWGAAHPITGTESHGPSYITALSCTSPRS